MKCLLAVCAALFLFGADARAQANVGITGIALISAQPIDEAYVGSPYLNEGIGGIGVGFGAGVNVIAANGFVIAGEYTRANFVKEQYGRLVRGGFGLDGIPATVRLHDSLLSVLAGYAVGGSQHVVFLGGISFRVDRPTIDEEEAEDYDNDDAVMPALTGGVDIVQPLSSRVQLLLSGRYTYNQRDLRLQYLGIGPHMLRGGAGLRVTLN